MIVTLSMVMFVPAVRCTHKQAVTHTSDWYVLLTPLSDTYIAFAVLLVVDSLQHSSRCRTLHLSRAFNGNDF